MESSSSISDDSEGNHENMNESLVTEFAEALQDILQDLKCLTCIQDEHDTVEKPDAELTTFKDQIVFLAKRILALHNGQDEALRRICQLEETISIRSAASERKLSGEFENIRVTGRSTNDAKTVDLLDSGCLGSPTDSLSNSSSKSGCTSYNTQGKPRNQEYGLTINTLNDEVCMELSAPEPWSTINVNKVMKKIAHVEQEYTKILQSVLAGIKGSEKSSFDSVYQIYVRHKVFQHTLSDIRTRCLHSSCRYTHKNMDFTLPMLRFWMDQDLVEAYRTIFKQPSRYSTAIYGDHYTLNHAGLHKNQSAREQSSFSIMIVRILWKHLHFLGTYLKGVRDSIICPDVHLDHVISTLEYLLEQTGDPFSLDIGKDPFLPFASAEKFPRIPVLQRDQAVQTQTVADSERRIRIEYVEGTSYITKFLVGNSTST